MTPTMVPKMTLLIPPDDRRKLALYFYFRGKMQNWLVMKHDDDERNECEKEEYLMLCYVLFVVLNQK